MNSDNWKLAKRQANAIKRRKYKRAAIKTPLKHIKSALKE